MKLWKNYRMWLLVVMTPLIGVMCMTIEDIIHEADNQMYRDKRRIKRSTPEDQ